MKAVFPGSFDPITLGHLDIIKRAASMFDSVCVLICNNSEKRGTFSLDTRKEIITEAVSDMTNVTVDVCDGLVTEYTEANGYNIIIRGIRDSVDATYEIALATINRSLKNHPETVFIPTKAEYSHVSSSFVRDMIKFNQPLNGIVPDSVISRLDK